jgi:hypothetical protein
MGCCGGRRRQAAESGRIPGVAARPAMGTDAGAARRSSHAHFVYQGRTGLTVVGPASGRTYRFPGPGAVVAVEPADRRALAAIPQLRQVGRP